MLFVTGAAGFLGRPLISRLLAEGVPVRCLCRPGAAGGVPPGTQAFEAALWDAGGLASGLRGCGTILHLAGKAHDLGLPDESEFRHVNVEGTRMLLQAAQQAEVRTFIFVSSVKAMGEGGDLCLDEDAPAVPRSSYGVSKLEAERLVLEMGSKAGMHVTVLRLPLVYGQGLKGNLRAMLDAVKRGTFPPPPRIRNRRSLVSTEDVVNAILLASGNRADRKSVV